MAHNPHIFPIDGQVNDETVPTPSDLEAMDQFASESLNGDHGGIWYPTSPIIIGGQGVSAQYGYFYGLTTKGDGLGGQLILGDNDFPTFDTPVTKSIAFNLTDVVRNADDYKLGTAYGFSVLDGVSYTPSGIQMPLVDTPVPYLAIPIPALRFPPGSTISSVQLRFRATMRPTGVLGFGTWPPAFNNSFRLSRIHEKGMPMSSLLSTGYTACAATTVDQFYNGGTPQGITMVPDQFNVVSTTTHGNWNYLLEILDPSGAMCLYHSLVVTFSNITTMQSGV